MTGKIEITVNGEARTFAGATVAALLAAEGVDPTARFVAVAVNDAVVPRSAWDEAALASGDAVEIVKPVSGG